jgi:hypothetical protein
MSGTSLPCALARKTRRKDRRPSWKSESLNTKGDRLPDILLSRLGKATSNQQLMKIML